MAGETEGDRLLSLFRSFDQNGDGKIDRSELKNALQQTFGASKWPDDRIDRVLTDADMNKDSAIQYEEFVTWVSKGGDDQAEFLKAAEILTPQAIDGLVRSISNISHQSGMHDLVAPLEELHAVPWETKEPAIALLLKLLQNILKDVANPKFRRLKLTNATLSAKVFSVPGCKELLLGAGFEQEGEELVLPEGVDIQWVVDDLTSFGSKELMDHQRAERDARIAAARVEEAKAKALKGHAGGGGDEERKRLLELAAYDKQERAAREKLLAEGYREEVPIAGEKTGAAVTRYGDIGVDLNAKGGG